MCLAIPGKIVTISEKTATVQYPKEQREVMLDPNIEVSIGDYVLIQMGIVIQKMRKIDALRALNAWKTKA